MPFHGLQGRVQRIVLWARVGTDINGEPTVSTVPEEMMVRWDDTSREVLGPEGQPIAIDATICGLTHDVLNGAAVWKGGIDDLPGTAQQPTKDVMRVVTFTPTPDIRGRSVYREATLMKSASGLGTQVAET